MKPLFAAQNFLFRRYRSLTILTVIFFASLVTAFSTGFWLPSRLAYVILVAVPLSYLWGRLSLWGVRAEAERRVDRLEQGQNMEERIYVYNRSWLPKLWLDVDDPSDLPGHSARRVVGLRPGEFRSWKVTTLCTRRGLYSMGPVTVTSGDLFGLFHFSRTFGPAQSILVYPRALELRSLYMPAAQLPGEGRLRRATHYVTPNAMGIRPYEFGDSYNRIHWPSTARTNELMVKLFEMDPASDIWVILDLEEKVHAGSGDESTEEYGVTIAASVARYFFRANRPLGLISFGQALSVVEPERGVHQYVRILESLALARAVGDVPLADLIAKEGKRFGRHTTVLAITPSTSEDWVTNLQALAERGTKLGAVLLEPSTFGARRNSLLAFGALAAADIYTYLVKRSDDLLAALGSGIDSRQAVGDLSRRDRP
jgi:uncharacterized protein (DUF58 family)